VVWNFRSGVLVETLGLTCRSAAPPRRRSPHRDLFDGFFQSAPPQLFAAVEAEAFGAYLAKRRPDVPYLDRCWASTSRRSAPSSKGRPQLVPFRFDPRRSWSRSPAAACRWPPSPAGSKSRSPQVGAGHTAVTGLLSR